MGAQLRVYKRRIRSVTATKKITKAMEMIAASRVVKAQRKVAASTPYARELTRAVTAVGTGSNTKHPLTTEADNPTRAAVLLLTSDRGLAGAFNSNAIKAAEQLTARLKKLESQMYKHAQNLEFEDAARVRDEMKRVREAVLQA